MRKFVALISVALHGNKNISPMKCVTMKCVTFGSFHAQHCTLNRERPGFLSQGMRLARNVAGDSAEGERDSFV